MKTSKLSLIAAGLLVAAGAVNAATTANLNLNATVTATTYITLTGYGNFNLEPGVSVSSLPVADGVYYSNNRVGYTVSMSSLNNGTLINSTTGINIPYSLDFTAPGDAVSLRAISLTGGGAGAGGNVTVIDSSTFTASEQPYSMAINVSATDFVNAPADVYNDVVKVTISAK